MGNPVTGGYATSSPMTFEIDLWNVEKGVKNLQLLSDAMVEEIEINAMSEFADRLVNVLKTNMALCGYPELGDYIYVSKSQGSVSVEILAPHAVYLEYGTGIKGEGDPHPEAFEHGWSYMVGDQSSKGGGWWYPAEQIYGSQKVWISKTNGQQYAWTNGGLPAGKFVYRTFGWGKMQYTRIFRRFLRNAIKRIGE